MSDLDVLRRLGDQVVPPPFDELRETARRRDRRLVVTSVAAVAAVVTAATVVLGPDDRPAPQPVEPPAPTSRPLTYADGTTIHYGDREIEAAGPVVELDLTDDGVAFRTADDRMWFSDGSATDQVGALGETGPGYDEDAWPILARPGWMLSANAGSRLVWFEFPAPGEPEVVVYDTREGQQVARDRVELRPGQTAFPALLSENFVYWYLDPDPELTPEESTRSRYDPRTGAQRQVTGREVYDDLNADAAVRSLRASDDQCGRPCPDLAYSDGMNRQMNLDSHQRFTAVGGVAPVNTGDLRAEDVTGEPFRFDRVPGLRSPGRRLAWMVQWLDDRTVVVVSPGPRGTDLVECSLDTHACERALALPGPVVVPEFGEVVYR